MPLLTSQITHKGYNNTGWLINYFTTKIVMGVDIFKRLQFWNIYHGTANLMRINLISEINYSDGYYLIHRRKMYFLLTLQRSFNESIKLSLISIDLFFSWSILLILFSLRFLLDTIESWCIELQCFAFILRFRLTLLEKLNI